jgi:hypothetical protein
MVPMVCIITFRYSGEKLSQLVKWLAPLHYNTKHEDSFEKHQEGTGVWLFDNHKFREWESSSPSILWIHGIPGCGKTILAYIALTKRSIDVANAEVDRVLSSNSRVTPRRNAVLLTFTVSTTVKKPGNRQMSLKLSWLSFSSVSIVTKSKRPLQVVFLRKWRKDMGHLRI